MADHDHLRRWTLVSYELPGALAEHRVLLWRRLRKRLGINLSHGVWAIPHGLEDEVPPDLDDVIGYAQRLGGETDVRCICDDRPADQALQGDLEAACEHLWGPFFAAADRVRVGLAAAPGSGGGLAQLHRRWTDLLTRDLVLSAGAHRAAAELDELEWISRNICGAVPVTASRPPAPGTQTGKRAWPQPRIGNTVRLSDGSARAVLCLSPVPDPLWESAFTSFELEVYGRNMTRVPMCHGAFIVHERSDELEQVVHRIRERVNLFKSFHFAE